MTIYQEFLMSKFGYLKNEVEDLTTQECIALISDLSVIKKGKIK